jgi:outer membrane biosynthesis protein TonB
MTYHLGPIDPDRRPELFGDPRDGEPQPRPRRVLATALALLVMGLFGGGLWFAYVQGTRHAGGGDAASGSVPLIRADERPTKVKPEKPGGMDIPDRDKLIYNPTRPVVEHLLPPPEKPLPRPAPPPNPLPPPEQPPAAAAAPASSAPGSPPQAAPPASTRTQQAAAAPPGKTPPAQAAPPKTATAGVAGTRLQLGSVRSEDAARQEWERVKHKNADLLGTLSATPIRADLGDKGIYYRILTGPVADQAAAERICSELKQRSVGCIVAR